MADWAQSQSSNYQSVFPSVFGVCVEGGGWIVGGASPPPPFFFKLGWGGGGGDCFFVVFVFKEQINHAGVVHLVPEYPTRGRLH